MALPGKTPFFFTADTSRPTVPIYLEPSTDEFSVRTPDGKWTKYRAESNPFLYENTNRTGIYIVAEGDKWRNFAVNLTSETESDIRNPLPSPLAQAGGWSIDVEPVQTKSPLWLVFLLVGFCILAMEWYFWMKGG